MNLNQYHLNALQSDLRDVAEAIRTEQPVWLLEPGDGWVKTRMVNADRPRVDYHLGEVPPA